MKRIATVVVLTIFVALATSSPASQAPADEPAALPLDGKIDQFWKLWESEQPSEALRRLSSTPQTPWANLYEVVDRYQSRLGGKCLGHVQLERKKISDKVVFVSFFAYYDVQPVKVELLYYKARDRWEGIACHVDINSTQWLREIAHPQESVVVPANGQGENQ